MGADPTTTTTETIMTATTTKTTTTTTAAAAYRPQWAPQLSALLIRNVRLFLRKPILLLSAMVLPAIAFLICSVIENAFNSTSLSAREDGLFNAPVPVAVSSSAAVYYIPASARTDAVMARFAKMNGLVYGSDVVSFSTEADAANAILKNYKSLVDKEWTFVRWNGDNEYVIMTDTEGSSATYLSDFDKRSVRFPKIDIGQLAFQQQIDAAIISYARDPTDGFVAGSDSIQLTLDWITPEGSTDDAFPIHGTRDDSTGFKLGSVFLIRPILSISFIPLMVLVMDVISKDKQDRLLSSFRQMGLMDSALWLALALPAAAVAIITSLLGAGAAMIVASSVPLFSNVTFEVVFIMNLSYALALIGVGLLCSSIVSKPILINSIVGAEAVAIVLITFIFFLGQSFQAALWFTNCQAIYAKILLFLFAPYFSYSKAWTDVSLVALPTAENNNTATTFGLSQLINTPRTYTTPTVGSGGYISPEIQQTIQNYKNLDTTGTTCLLLIVSFFLFLILAWYLNQVLPSVDGFSRPFYFPVTSSYWTGRQKRTKSSEEMENDRLVIEKGLSAKSDSVRILKLSKQYKGVTAVKEFSAVFEHGKVYALLGHNGAGKTSLIKMLALETSPSFGECFMFGMDIREDSSALQSLMSICPQFDVLSPSLTAYQHLEFSLKFCAQHRDLSRAQLKQLIFDKLASVDLDGVAHKAVQTFSGGMKRRLSLCLATLSKYAKIVFLDEPTTGLDPLSRRKSWKVIQDLKKDRVVVLTTHDMNEADALGDQVCIMHNGRLRASGSPIFLKNRFGQGYQLSVVPRSRYSDAGSDDTPDAFKFFSMPGSTRTKETTVIEEYVRYALPGCGILSSAAGALSISVNKQGIRQLASFLRALKADATTDWSVSNSTLEEVFLKLCAENKAVTTDSEGSSAPTDRLCAVCNRRAAETVTLYTKIGVKVIIPNFVCAPCADGNADGTDTATAEKESSEDDIVTLAEFAKRLPPLRSKKLDTDALQRGSSAVVLATGPGLVRKQIGAVVVKNFRLDVKQVRLNICVIIFFLILIIATVLIPSGSTIPPSCNGVVFTILGSNKGSCDPLLLSRAFSVYSDCSSSSQPTQNRAPLCAGGNKAPFSAVSDANGFLYVYNEYSDGYIDSDVVRNLLFDGNTTYGRNLHVMYSEASQNALKLTELLQANLFSQNPQPPVTPSPSGIVNAQLPNNSNSGHALFYSHPASDSGLANSLRAAQRGLLAKKASFPKDKCYGLAGKSGAQYYDLASIQADWKGTYPDAAMDIASLSVSSSAVKMQYTLLAYPHRSTNNYVPLYVLDGDTIKQLTYQSRASEQPPTLKSTGDTCFGVTPQTYLSETNIKASGITLVNGISNAILSKLPNGNSTGSTKGIVTSYAYFPPFVVASRAHEDMFDTLLRAVHLLLFLLTTSIFLPRVVQFIVLEKKENLVDMMRIQGLSLVKFWIGNYLYFFCLIGILNVAYFILQVLLNSEFGISSVLGAQVLWVHGQICLCVLLGAVISQPMLATMIATMLYMLSAIVSPLLLLIADADGSLPTQYLLFPPSAFISLVNVISTEGSTSAVIANVVIPLISSSVLGLIGCYIHAVRPTPVGIPVDPLLGLGSLLKSKDGMIKSSHRDAEAEPVDADVAREEMIAHQLHVSGTPHPDEAIRLVDVRKAFGSKLSVRTISLVIKNGETFGLLGPNGAGKTTTLSMLTGLLKRSSGAISISGIPIDEALASRGGSGGLWKYIGVTPQFDTIWADMTVEEHLFFYCRLRGVSSKLLNGMVRQIAEDVELDGDAFRQRAGGLSGGMKRRLSIGISLTANPKILVLDEPTTGLDPETKRQIWRIIEKLKSSNPNRCVVITTHSMEEADALCTRIGIMRDGSLKVLGSQVHLKSKFGKGMKLTLRVPIAASPSSTGTSVADLQQVEDTRIREVASRILTAVKLPADAALSVVTTSTDLASASAIASMGASNELNWLATAQIVIPRDMIDISDVFVSLEEACASVGIQDFVFSETTLEDVFIDVAEGAL